MTYDDATYKIRREAETEEWVRKVDAGDIVARLHELEDRIKEMEGGVEKALEQLREVEA